MENKKKQELLNRFISKGYRYAWVAKETHSLSTALTFKQVSTSEEGAIKEATKVIMPNRSVKVWQLEKELLHL